MKKTPSKISDVPSVFLTPSAAFLIAIFLCGAVMGTVCACKMPAHDNILSAYADSYISSLSGVQISWKTFAASLFDQLRYPCFICLSGIIGAGILLIPAAIFFRGFFLSFLISSLICSGQNLAFLTSIILFAPYSLISIPCTLVLSSWAFTHSRRMTAISGRQNRKGKGGKRSRFARDYIFQKRIFVCFGVFLMCAVVQAVCVPWLYAFFISAN